MAAKAPTSKAQSSPSPGADAFLPMSAADMKARGWSELDVLLVTGDAYIDHPSFGVALLGRLLEREGWRVGILAQPDWHSADPFRAMGRPRLFAGVSGGAMDSMVSSYTARRRFRHRDMYSPGGEGGKRPDRAVLVYANRLREAFPGLPIVLGGVEASLRRFAHYDYWQDKLRRSWLLDAKADLLVYGHGEGLIQELARRLHHWHRKGADRQRLTRVLGGLRGTVVHRPATETPPQPHLDLPSWEEVRQDKKAFMKAALILERESNPLNAPLLRQQFGDRAVWAYPPQESLSSVEFDDSHELPYTRRPHPSYQEKIPAWETIKFSLANTRGCFGGCTFCAITLHQGRKVVSRSEASILREVEQIKQLPGFTGTLSDVGGPTANMYRMACSRPEVEAVCKRTSCIHPKICKLLDTDHRAQIDLLRRLRQVEGVKKVFVASGVRYDLANRSPEYIEELAAHHVGGQISVAPESTDPAVLQLMKKPGIKEYERFEAAFRRASEKAGKEQYLIPYFIASHPGATEDGMEKQAQWLQAHGYRLQQVQDFTPTPMTLATAMYYSGFGPDLKPIPVAKGEKARQRQKDWLRYHDPESRKRLGLEPEKKRHPKGRRRQKGRRFPV
ncbi:MAG: YgiQ family radical SAM protein [Planctomycetota bacterium]|nr:MAG: YgiQ family radical SAM protein [Planctomycetota bacterium]